MNDRTYHPRPAHTPDFLSKKAPPNYIAGLGRGATGFTTRSDIGPAREQAPELPVTGPKENDDDGTYWYNYGSSSSRSSGRISRLTQMYCTDPERFQDPDQETGLFGTLPYGADDEEADRIYASVDEAMDLRRRARREAREKEQLEAYRKERPKIQLQFADLKRSLQTVSPAEWASIPDASVMRNASASDRKISRFKDRLSAAPSIVSVGAGFSSNISSGSDAASGYATSIDPRMTNALSFATPMPGQLQKTSTPSVTVDTSKSLTDLVQFGQGRNKVLGLKLDAMSDSVSGQSTVDPKGYLTDLNSIITKTDAEISDIKKARQLLRSVITTNPKHAPGWIAAARLEEVAQKIPTARDLAAKGCIECPKSEDIWLESARLNSTENAKIILASAVREIPTSVKIWLRASQLENDTKAQKRVLRRALEFIPNSVKIWKAAVSLEEDSDDARILLGRAVECVPLATELWLALARLESYENAKKVICAKKSSDFEQNN
ncbi:hypothetical protein HK100_012297 [Physocladia obscura]|uniref:PRP1 splicing factor N-terminal domain-containing protein n=1 Tax=Physocladia obscura TaxID=109957 RepID=A0AAD5T2J9_9FUNG|nr:hypothetical protein HK100_012297 [Physocladia obscura]